MDKKSSASKAAKEFSKLGASKGGQARALLLTAEERSDIARNAVMARWDKNEGIPKATHMGEIKIGHIVIPCAVLGDGTRVLSERSVANTLGSKGGGAYWQKKKKEGKSALLPEYVSNTNLEPYITEDIRAKLTNPVTYRPLQGRIANGIEAGILPVICNIWLTARDNGALTKKQENVAKKADILMRGLAHIGIIALVDEATGYQYDRARKALEKILDKFIAKELQPWVKTFPDEYYKEIFRLNNWKFNQSSPKRPVIIGKWTNDIVYGRLAPGVRKELKNLTERDKNGRPKHRYFQKLSKGTGHPKLKEHLAAVVALMKAAPSWGDFKKMLQLALPAYGSNYEIPFDE